MENTAQNRHTPHIADIEAQIRWEMSGVERGAQRVREQMAEQNLGDGVVGTKLMRRVASALIAKIEAAQIEAAEGVAAARRGAPVLWWWLITLLDADQLAVIVLKATLSERPRDFTFHRPVSGVAAVISSMAQQQIDFEAWKAAESGKPREENLFLRYLRTNTAVNAKTFKRFSDRIDRQRIEKWDHKVGIAFGTKLVQLLCEAAPDWFSVNTNRLRGGRHEAQLMFSDDCKEMIAELAEQSELSRPMLLPMICPPADWRIAA